MSNYRSSNPNARLSNPPEAWEPLLRLLRFARAPLERFLQIEAAGGVVLLLSAAVALVWANSPWSASYVHFWHTPVGVRIGGFVFERSLEWYVNDCLMVLFFFVVGMEIRRELHHGELAEWRRAVLPAIAALGGMLAPALFYLAFANEAPSRSGWGVPMATDIAFAVGVLALLGKRVPPALRILLLALAVIDDLGAILVIAVFYSSGLAVTGLAIAALGLGAIFVMQRLGVRSKLGYVAPSLVVWAGVYAAGVHPTIAGVLVGLVTPVREWLGAEGLVVGLRSELNRLAPMNSKSFSSHSLDETLRYVDTVRREALSPAESLIEKLHPWVAFVIMPVFALANAGVNLSGTSLDVTAWRVVLGVVIGLVVGKPVGVLLAIALTLGLRLGALPKGITFRHLLVLGTVAGVGFTMSLFVAQLAFIEPRLLSAAKVGVLAASALAAIAALGLGRLTLTAECAKQAVQSADDAEAVTKP